MKNNFEEFCEEQKMYSTCEECIYSEHRSSKECEKNFGIDNTTYVTQFELNCTLRHIESILVSIIENVNLIEDELSR